MTIDDITPQNPLRQWFGDAIRYWEPRRLVYNLVLGIVCAAWVVFSWPHFRPGLTLQSLLLLSALAAIANICYCAAYVVDLCAQSLSSRTSWGHVRWILWLSGTLFAILLSNYWIVDEIYPFVRE
jgi:hypothetical protein